MGGGMAGYELEGWEYDIIRRKGVRACQGEK